MAKLKLEEIEKKIKEKKIHWKAKDNKFSKMDEKELKKLLGVKPDKLKAILSEVNISAATPGFSTEKDWRTTNNVTPVKDQGNCGSCVSFGTIAVVESMLSIEKNETYDLSEGDCHFC